MVGEATRGIGRRAGTGEQRQTDPVTREELSPSGVASWWGEVRGARAGSADLQPLAGVGAKDAGRRALPCTQNSRHGDCRSRPELDGGVSLVAVDHAAGAVNFAECEQPLRITCRCRSAQMSRCRHAVAGDVPRDQTECEMSRHIAARRHVGEMGTRALMAPGRGALQPLNRFSSVVNWSGLFEVHECQQVLGRSVPLNRHVEQNRPALHARIGRCRKPVGHCCAVFDVRRGGRRRAVRFR